MKVSWWLMLLLFLLPGSSAFGQQSGGNGVPGGGSSGSGSGSPTGAAGGVLTGTYPNPTLANPLTLPVSTTGEVINGVGYSANYPQSTLSGRINACIADAEAGTNGNTSHKCDSSGEAYAQTDSSGVTITVGNAAGNQVTWIHPAYCNWSFTGFTGGTADAMDEYGGAAIEGNTPVNGKCVLYNNSVTTGMRAVFETVPTTAGNLYFSVKGMGFANQGVGLGAAATMVINTTNDGSIFEDLMVTNYVSNENAILFTGTSSNGACCATTLNRVVAAGNYSSGPILMFNTSNFSAQTAVFIEDSSIGHPASGQPNIECTNSTTPATAYAVLSFDNVYMEGANGGTAPFIESNGCQSMKFSGVTMFARTSSSSTQPAIQLNGSYNTAIDVSGLSMFKGFTYPAVAVQNNVSGFNCASTPCSVSTDSNGNLGHYTNATLQGDVINASVGFDVAGSPLAFSNVAGTASAAHGGTGTTSLTGLRYANSGSADTAGTSAQVQSAIGSGVYQAAGSVASASQYQIFYQPNATAGATAAGSTTVVTDSSGDLINLNAVGSAVASSPFTEVCGAYEASSTPTYGSDCWTVQDVVGSGVNGTSTLTLSHVGSTSGLHNISLNAGTWVEAPGIEGNVNTNSVNYLGGQDSSTGGTTGSAILRGSNNSGNAGTSGSVTVEPGAESGTGATTQGFATFNQSFTVAAALSATFEVVSMTTTADRVQAAAVGSASNNIGVAQTVGGSGTPLYVATTGKTTVRFDGTPVVGDIACFPPSSTGTAGLAHDNGSAACTAGQKLGVVTGQVSGTGSGATATVLLQIGS